MKKESNKIELYNCANCTKQFKDYPSRAKRRKNHFCSKDCHDNFRRFTVIKKCAVCEATWTAIGATSPEYRRITCSDECAEKINEKTRIKKGNIPWNFKGWRKTTQGYIEIYAPEHPNANKNGYYKKTNLVMEEHLGRILMKEEVVHHIDRDRINDSLENLMLFPSNSAHIEYHYFVLGDKYINDRERSTKFDISIIKSVQDMYKSGDYTINKISNIHNLGWETTNRIIKDKNHIYSKVIEKESI